jgi:hypothetical protein
MPPHSQPDRVNSDSRRNAAFFLRRGARFDASSKFCQSNLSFFLAGLKPRPLGR